VSGEWHNQEGLERIPRWLYVEDVPSLSGESGLALIGLLEALCESIDNEYAAEIEACRRARCSTPRARFEDEAWLAYEDPQLRLDLGDDDFF